MLISDLDESCLDGNVIRFSSAVSGCSKATYRTSTCGLIPAWTVLRKGSSGHKDGVQAFPYGHPNLVTDKSLDEKVCMLGFDVFAMLHGRSCLSHQCLEASRHFDFPSQMDTYCLRSSEPQSVQMNVSAEERIS